MSVMNTLMGGGGGVDSSGTGWIRFTDGTQICWQQATGTADVMTSGNIYPDTLTFPKAFSSAPYVVLSPEYDSVYKNAVILNLGTVNTTTCKVYLLRTTGGNTTSITYYVVAIGKWK